MNNPSALNNSASLFDQIWVISLPTAHDRRRHIAEHLPAAGFPDFKFFDATSADDPAVAAADPEVKKYPPCFRCGLLDCGKPNCNNFLLPAQIAVVLTYRRLWREIAEGEAQCVLVVEDDVWFHPQTGRVLSWIQEEIAATRLPFHGTTPCLLRLGWARNAEHEAESAQPRAEAVVRMSNPCHAITRAYARALIERDQGIVHTADVYQHELAPKPGEAFSIFPPIASELSWSEGRFASLIHPKAVHVDYLRRTGDVAAASDAERRVERHVKKKFFRPLLITGHSYCGLAIATALCARAGLDIGQDKAGQHGFSSWMFAVDADANPILDDDISRTRRALVWQHMIVPVRDLRAAAPLVAAADHNHPALFAFRRTHIQAALGVDIASFESPLERAVRSIISWMRLIVAQKPALVFRIEDQQELLRDFLLEKRLTVTRPEAEEPPDVSHNISADTTLSAHENWDSFSDDTKREIAWYCRTFGYASPLA